MQCQVVSATPPRSQRKPPPHPQMLPSQSFFLTRLLRLRLRLLPPQPPLRQAASAQRQQLPPKLRRRPQMPPS